LTDRYAVIGNPVGHSQSPQIHEAFARQTGQDLFYGRLLAPLDDFSDTALRFFAEGGAGLNVTVPFKHEAWRLVDARVGGAESAEAVNTIRREGTRLIGHNTDGTGLVADLERNLGIVIAGRRVLLMGAGGASHGVVQPLLERKPAALVIANRTPDKAEQLALRFAGPGRNLRACGYTALAGESFDLVVNATSAGLSGELPPLPDGLFTPGALAYDMMYGRLTAFLAFARARGAATADGLGMLVEQAAEAFQIWRGVRPQTAPVIAQLRAAA
jgi:shikimate dehydrogenase